MERLAALICALIGHRLWHYETDLYGLVFICTRCGSTYRTDYEPIDSEDDDDGL